MARVGMHFGYFGHALCRSSKNYTIEFSNNLKADKPVYTFNSGKDEYTQQQPPLVILPSLTQTR